MDIRTFCFCLDVCEDETLAPIYGDYLEDAGLARHHATPCSVVVSLEQWMSLRWQWVWLEPIIRVTLNDREPYRWTWATWIQQYAPEDHGDLPHVIVRYLRGEIQQGPSGAIARYETLDLLDDASQALIAWARDKVRQELGEHIVC